MTDVVAQNLWVDGRVAKAPNLAVVHQILPSMPQVGYLVIYNGDVFRGAPMWGSGTAFPDPTGGNASGCAATASGSILLVTSNVGSTPSRMRSGIQGSRVRQSPVTAMRDDFFVGSPLTVRERIGWSCEEGHSPPTRAPCSVDLRKRRLGSSVPDFDSWTMVTGRESGLIQREICCLPGGRGIGITSHEKSIAVPAGSF